jgi:hypothetical protein
MPEICIREGDIRLGGQHLPGDTMLLAAIDNNAIQIPDDRLERP